MKKTVRIDGRFFIAETNTARKHGMAICQALARLHVSIAVSLIEEVL